MSYKDQYAFMIDVPTPFQTPMTWVEVVLTFSAALFVCGLVGGHTRLGRHLLWSSAAVIVVLLLSFGREIVFEALL